MSDRKSDRGAWICDECVNAVPNACIFTVGEIIPGPCEVCGKVLQPYKPRHLADWKTFDAACANLRKRYRPELELPIPRIASLPIQDGWPVPFFVDTLPDGTFEFRASDRRKIVACVTKRLCWVCGQKLDLEGTFTIGPMCAINRTTAEPPSHAECAEWSVRNCPFLRNPNAERREPGVGKGMTKGVDPAGIMIKRNPKVILLWTCKGYRIYKDGEDGVLFNVGPPIKTQWFTEGRPATRREVEESIATGIPLLLDAAMAHDDPRVALEITKRAVAIEPLFPPKEIVTS
jgi:hypothetical protein